MIPSANVIEAALMKTPPVGFQIKLLGPIFRPCAEQLGHAPLQPALAIFKAEIKNTALERDR